MGEVSKISGCARLASLLEPAKRRYVPTWGSSISRYWQRFGLATGGDEDETKEKLDVLLDVCDILKR